MLLGTFDSLGDFDRGLRSYYSSWDNWEFEIERLRPPSEEGVAWVGDTGAAVGADAVKTVANRYAVAVAHFETRYRIVCSNDEECRIGRESGLCTRANACL
jgi:hypothetical protein